MSDRLENLNEVLDKIFDFMEKQGIKLDHEEKNSIKETMHDALRNSLTTYDIQDKEVQKKLLFCVTSLVLKNNKDFLSMVDLLKDDEDKKLDEKGLGKKYGDQLEPKDHEKRLTNQFDLLKILMFLIQPEGQKQLSSIALTMKNDKKNNADEDKADEKDNLLAKETDAFLRNLYGGENPTMSGEVAYVVQYVFGNIQGLPNLTTPNPQDLSFMVEAITYNTNTPAGDDLGLETRAKMADISQGVPDLSEYHASPANKIAGG